MDVAPLILTLAFDADSFERLNGLRQRHFPAQRNHIPAHLTLFHKLPGQSEPAIVETLREVAASVPSALSLKTTGLRFLGYGSAYEISSPALTVLRNDLATRWRDWLGPQDAQGFRPHVTIQNKAPSGPAKELFAHLKAGFTAFEASGTGLLLWRYRGGPWEAAGRFPFASHDATG